VRDNPWLAIDAATMPAERARQVRVAWEAFVGDGELEAVRVPIAHSWQRSYAAGVDPSSTRIAPVVAESDQVSALWEMHPLAAAVPVISQSLGAIAEAANQLIVISDADGLLLWIDGPARVRVDAVQVFAAEHFNEVVQQWTCAAAPIHDPDTDALLGVIDLTGRINTAHPSNLACALAAAQAVEAHLRCVLQERDAHLRARFEERLGGGAQHALVTPSGRVIAGDEDGWTGAERLVVPAGGGEMTLPSGVPAFAEPVGHEEAFVLRAVEGGQATPRRPCVKLHVLARDHAEVTIDGQPIRLGRRHTEILALLSARPPGMTAEELASDLYGDSGQPGTVRVTMHRLRKLLGPWIATEPYRLTLDVESDVARVRGLLDRGEVRDAAEAYAGALLPHSEAPGVARERVELDRWLRQAILTSDDARALWAWTQTPSGEDDALAWKRLLAQLDYADPRRSFAATRVSALRAAVA